MAQAAQSHTVEERAPQTLQDALREGKIGKIQSSSHFAACLMPLLEALIWRGDPVLVAEALPHFATSLDLVGFRNTLANLNFATTSHRIPLSRIDARLAPCIYVPDNGVPMVVTLVDINGIHVFDSGSGKISILADPGITGIAYFVSRLDNELAPSARTRPDRWLSTLTRRFRPLVYSLLLFTFLLNALALAVPIFVMLVYDRVVSTGSLSTLVQLGAGIVIVLGFDLVFRTVRAHMLAHIGARFDMIVGTNTFEHILNLSADRTESVTVAEQIGRIKQFERSREFFAGPIAVIYLELPFVPLILGAILWLAGPLAAIPVVLMALFALVAVILSPRIRNSIAQSSKATVERQGFIVEAFSKMRSIKTAGAETVWAERFRGLSSQSAMSGFEMSRNSALLQTSGYILMIIAGTATLAFGTLRVLDGDMTLGALIATMMLVWRALGPLQTGFLSLPKLNQVRSAFRQVNQLMSVPPEREHQAAQASQKRFAGRVTFAQISLRYSAYTEPALFGVAFDVEPGEVIGVIGPNGSGKSSILKLILGLYHPQGGAVLIDGLNVRQIDPIELRRQIAYVPQKTDFFYGTIAQNLRLADPVASDKALRRAARDAGVLQDILQLPSEFDTRIGDQTVRTLPAGFLRRLSLARAYLKQTQIFLFDEPSDALDERGDQAFMKQIAKLRGKKTVFIVTHRPSHMKLADRLLVFDKGVLVSQGVPDVVLQKPMDDA
ncbi:MAG: ATP-binding cassette domain-containing protein [Alphaproteobacteria bacterium]|nr:ATP-binding cassette domain-containing protein [Alphaproteobacteria bacterium]